MKKLILIFCILSLNNLYGQANKALIESFVNDILINKKFDAYDSYIHHFNQISKKDSQEFLKYKKGIEFMIANTVSKSISDKKNIGIIDITRDTTTIKRYIHDEFILPSYQVYGVFEKNEFKTAIILNEQKEIISFMSNLTKTDNRHRPMLLTENIY